VAIDRGGTTLTGIPRMTPKLGQMFAVFRPSGKIEASFGQLPSPRTARTVVEGLISLFFQAVDLLLNGASSRCDAVGSFRKTVLFGGAGG
jgi:hypothetical protein